ncbi:NAD-dependent DNA ligase LigA [Litorihabitans aurantiacus]|uniref:DNA ligase n=1 Tax=Litorihabitans aurantiacus TaxID=1930061 RepID=A0AA37UVI1_9MICO|nr:NAD-dependent DNA ligase LigA [Litorihabitans aurantiacus]GMA31092.1 DNA ligase 2 [Litorihabitans aurantiacus]
MTTTDQTTAELTALARRLRAAASAYYDGVEELMSDAEYDAAIDALRAGVAADPALEASVADLLTAVAAGQSKGGDVVHPSLMGSMEKARTLDEVAALVAAVAGPVLVEPKLDGLAVRAVYLDGELRLVATRGNGSTGENITSKVRTLEVVGLPPRLADAAVSVEVRGEVFMADADFPRAQEVRAELGGSPFINQRNGAAGILRKGDTGYARLLRFAAYDVVPLTTEQRTIDDPSYARRLLTAGELGITTANGLVEGLDALPTTDGDDVVARVALLDAERDRLGFPIDGAVVKADDDADRLRLGMGSRAPKWAVAYKYEAQQATTTVRAITTTVGRTGRLSIRVEVDPVFVGGTTITYATGHNAPWMLERDVREGDTVVIKRAGDVIPYIETVVVAARPADSAPWVPPETDPNGNPWDKSTLLWRSTDPTLSVGGLIEYAVTRDALDVEGIGSEIVAALVENDHVLTVADLFTLSEETLTALPLSENRTLGSKNAAKIVREIERARSAPWNRVITSLGMRMTGRTTSRRLAAAFPTRERLVAATVAELADVDGIGPIKAEVIHQGLHEHGGAAVLAALAEHGVNTGSERDSNATDLPLAGMTIVVSGSVPGYTRTTVAEMIEARGGRSSSSVSAATSLLVSEPSTSAKYVKAGKLGVRIVTPQEFLELAGA